MGGFTTQFVVALTVTMGLALVSGCLGTAVGLFLAISKGMALRPRLKSAVTAYTTVVRGVPELLIILLIYFG